MNRKMIKLTSIFTIFFFVFYLIISLAPGTILVPRAEASSLDKGDIYKGVGLALALILIAKLGEKVDSSDSKNVIRYPDSTDSYSQADIDLLARVIYAESRGEPYEGQVAVGAVVLNRVKSSKFPNTIRGVVYQDMQFSSVRDGQINLVPNATAYRAANDAIDGIDPSQGALYFYNPNKADNLWWFSTRTETTRIGNHAFLK